METEQHTLTTSETVTLPLVTEATMLGAVFAAPSHAVQALLPDGVRPIQATARGDAAITFLSVEYHRVGDGEIAPYNEFAVILPAIHSPTTTIPYVSPLLDGTSGFMWYLPVTTEPAKALGVDIWGFPKVVADITHEDDGDYRRTTVTIDGQQFITFEIARPPTVTAQTEGYTYTSKNGNLLRVPNAVDAAIGGWPLSSAVSVTFGEHPRADSLRTLGIGSRALSRVAVDGEVRFYPGELLART